jgi:hypothetical protein
MEELTSDIRHIQILGEVAGFKLGSFLTLAVVLLHLFRDGTVIACFGSTLCGVLEGADYGIGTFAIHIYSLRYLRYVRSISRERASSDVQPGLPKVSSPMKPPRHPSISGAPVDAPPAGQTANGFEFNIPRVYSEGALETPHRLVKQYSGEF